MKRLLTTITCCLCFYALIGQEVNIDMCDVLRHTLIKKNSDTISTILELEANKLSNVQKADLYSMRGRMTMYLNKRKIKKRSTSSHPLLKESYEDLTMAISLIPDEKDKLKYIARRYSVFEKYEPNYKDFNKDKNKLMAKGLKKDRTGLGASLVTRFDGEFWAGAELSLFSGYAPSYTVKDENGDKLLSKKLTISASAFVFGFTKNLENDLNDYNFSLLRIEAPLFIDLVKFGYIQAPGGKNHWYYRPEIGVGYSLFHLSGGYNVFFKSYRTENLGNLSLNFRIKYTF